MFQKPDPKQSFPKLEEHTLERWKKEKTFEKSLEKNKGRPEYVFYDGPPFATGLPHYGHILAGTLKDVIPRYQTMRGHYVPRRWGWDCHGLPIENLVEKELELNDKQAILDFGVDQFNEACRSSVLRYVKEWGKVVERMGRWVDFEDSYKTMDASFMESIWWVFKTLWDKELIYKGKKAMHICPRCVTPLSNFEVGLGYKDVTDFSTTVQFRLKETPQKKKLFGDATTYVLAWTTTTWTLPGNIMLAVGKDIEYALVKRNKIGKLQQNPEGIEESPIDPSLYICATSLLPQVFKENEGNLHEELKTFKGEDLIGLEYEPLFDAYVDKKLPNIEKGWHIYAGDFVTTDSGTGVVHIAPGYGEDDMNLAVQMKMPVLQHVEMDGKFSKELGHEFNGYSVSNGTEKKKSDEYIAKILGEWGKVFKTETYRHSYPHCWRCDTPLLNYATNSWFVDIDKVKKKMLASNDKINWVPEHIKHGRFGKWLENARDWAISRNRYWGTPLPVWEGENGATECLGSIAELRARIPERFTKITFVRHGESEGNTIGLRQSVPPGTGLTEKGKAQAEKAGKELAKIHEKEPFDIVLHSPLLRTEETAQIIAEQLFEIQNSKFKIQKEPLVREINFGNVEGKRDHEVKEYMEWRENLPYEERYHTKSGETGESHEEVTKRALEFVQKMVKEHAGKSILVVTHSDIIRLLLRELEGGSLELLYTKGHYAQCEPKELYFDNTTGKLVDLHKHFVDDMTYAHPETGELMKRIPEVLDCWFESGSMPYAQAHYPFENKERFEATFPANFIAEGLDQTRGWFYTLVVLSSALFDEPAFQNVIVNGIVLAEDGQKMSKSKKNYPDPQLIFDQFGADAMRIYLMHSPVVKADDLRFSEKGVQEVVRSTLLPLWNAYSFLLTYAEIDGWKPRGQLYFVRHGETDVNKADKLQGWMDEPLNDHGRDQIQKLRKITKDLPIDVIVSSDFIRAKQSADILNTDFGLEIEEWIDLREQKFGDYEGRRIGEIEFENNPLYELRKAPPGGETIEEYEKRVLAAVEQVKKKYAGKNILLVAHGGVYHVLHKHQLGLTSWEEYYEDHFYRTKNGELVLFETAEFEPKNKLDRWIMSELHTLIKGMTEGLDQYDLAKGLDPLVRFIDSLTNWYIRRSRRRFWKSENDGDKSEAYQTLYTVLVETCKLLAPFAPFITEEMYRNLSGLESVHLSKWPEVEPKRIDEALNQEIALAQLIVTLGHAARAKANVKVRQPLQKIEVALPPSSEGEDGHPRLSVRLAEQLDVIREELNVKEIEFLDSVAGKVQLLVKPNARLLGPKYGAAVQDIIRKAKEGAYHQLKNGNYLVQILESEDGHPRPRDIELTPDEIEISYQPLDEGKGHQQVESDQGIVVILETEITSELLREGYARDIVRSIQDLRKQADLNVADRIKVGLTTTDPEAQKAIVEFEEYIKKETLAVEISADKRSSSFESVVSLGGHGVTVTVEKA
ncbi:MAG: class I tRNA ligase family protein [Candidatus Altimarinota bacterium]